MELTERDEMLIKEVWNGVFQLFDAEPDTSSETVGRLAHVAERAVERELRLICADYTVDGEPISDICQWYADIDATGPERRHIDAMKPGDSLQLALYGESHSPRQTLRRV